MANIKAEIHTPSIQTKVYRATLNGGLDGTTWYLGTPEKIETFKSGDFCFDDENFDIYRCNDGKWELLCNLNNLHLINKLCAKYEVMMQELVDNAKEHPSYREWWFGTREEYNALSTEDRNKKLIYFIEEGT